MIYSDDQGSVVADVVVVSTRTEGFVATELQVCKSALTAPTPTASSASTTAVPSAVVMTVGEERSYAPAAIDGRVPQVRVCGTYGLAEPDTEAVLVDVDGPEGAALFRAVAVGKVDLCALPLQAFDKCQPTPCADLMGDLVPLTTVTVQAA